MVNEMSDFTKSRISRTDNHSTPQELYDSLNAEFNFDDDPCPLNGELLQDGLSRPWGMVSFLNPPYSNPAPWCKKAYEESLQGKTIVGLLRGDTSTKWFHEWVLGPVFCELEAQGITDWSKAYAKLRFIKGRLNFGGVGPAPFASIIAIWGTKED